MDDTGTIAQRAIDDALVEARATHPGCDTETELREAIRVLAVMYAAEHKRVSSGYVRRGLSQVGVEVKPHTLSEQGKALRDSVRPGLSWLLEPNVKVPKSGVRVIVGDDGNPTIAP